MYGARFVCRSPIGNPRSRSRTGRRGRNAESGRPAGRSAGWRLHGDRGAEVQRARNRPVVPGDRRIRPIDVAQRGRPAPASARRRRSPPEACRRRNAPSRFLSGPTRSCQRPARDRLRTAVSVAPTPGLSGCHRVRLTGRTGQSRPAAAHWASAVGSVARGGPCLRRPPANSRRPPPACRRMPAATGKPGVPERTTVGRPLRTRQPGIVTASHPRAETAPTSAPPFSIRFAPGGVAAVSAAA